MSMELDTKIKYVNNLKNVINDKRLNELSEDKFTFEKNKMGGSSDGYKVSILIEGNVESYIYKKFNYGGGQNLENRKKENLCLYTMGQLGLGPKVIFYNEEFRVEEFLETRPIKCYEINYPNVRKNLAYTLGRIHSIKDIGIPKIEFLDNILNNVDIIEGFKKNLDISKYTDLKEKETIKLAQNILNKDLSQIRELTKDFSKVLSNNDVWVGNILISHDLTKVYYIDYEMVAYNFRGYDLGKLILETMYEREEDRPAYKLNRDYFPSNDEIVEYIIYYDYGFFKSQTLDGKVKSIEEVDKEIAFDRANHPEKIDEILKSLRNELNVGMMVCGWYMGLLGIYLAFYTSFGIDFMQFARDGLDIYYHYKDVVEGTKVKS